MLGDDAMLRMKYLSDVYDMPVYTEEGDYFGRVEEVLITPGRIQSWMVKATRGSYIQRVLGVKGVIIPHKLVISVGDVMIISRNADPARPQEE